MRSSSISDSTSARIAPALSRQIAALEGFFASNGLEAYLCGGGVRDALLGRESRDLDVAVAGDAEATSRALASLLGGKSFPLSLEHGIMRVVVASGDDQLSVDVGALDGGIREDLARRDFTVDAMALPLGGPRPASLEDVVDPHGGLSDLRQRLIRAVSPSAFEADPARLLRAPRLASQLGFTIVPDTAEKIRRNSSLVTRVAPERIRDELLKVLEADGATASMRLLDELELLCRVIPELEAAKGVSQPRGHHYWDVFNHLVETPGFVEKSVVNDWDSLAIDRETATLPHDTQAHLAAEFGDGHTRLTFLKLAGLLHDIGKPATKTVEDSGRVRFLGHDVLGAEMAESILRRLRFSERGVGLVSAMVRHHLRPAQMSQRGELPSGRAIYRYYRDLGDAAIDTLYLNMADYRAARGPDLDGREWSDHCRLIGYVINQGLEGKTPQTLPKLVNGHDIMEAFSLSPGPRVGSLVGLVHEAQASGEISTKGEALELARVNLDAKDDRA